MPPIFLKQLNIPPNVLLWIINFLSSRTQAVSSFGQISGWLPITQSIIQGSGIGPYLYMIYASDLRPLSPYNVIVKYADDTTYLSVNIAQLISPRNMKISPHVLSSTSLRSTLVKQRRLFFIDLLLGTSISHLLCLELNESRRPPR